MKAKAVYWNRGYRWRRFAVGQTVKVRAYELFAKAVSPRGCKTWPLQAVDMNDSLCSIILFSERLLTSSGNSTLYLS